MSLLLGILSVIGKILLILLGTAVLLLLAVLLIPFRYSGHINGDKNSITADAHITWLFRAAAFSVEFLRRDGRNSRLVSFRIFGISPAEIRRKVLERRAEKRRQKKKERLEEIRREDPERYEHLKEEAYLRKHPAKAEDEAARSEHERQKMIRKKKRKDLRSSAREEIRRAGSFRERTKIRRNRLVHELAKFYAAVKKSLFILTDRMIHIILIIWHMPGKLFTGTAAFAEKAAGLINNAVEWINFLEDMRTRKAVRRLKRSLFGILSHIRPRSVKGRAVIGLGDPAATGQVMGITCALAPVYGDSLSISPDFTEKHLEGELDIRGRIFLGRLLGIVVFAILDRNVRFCYHYIKNRSKEEG